MRICEEIKGRSFYLTLSVVGSVLLSSKKTHNAMRKVSSALVRKEKSEGGKHKGSANRVRGFVGFGWVQNMRLGGDRALTKGRIEIVR